jgi:hypothetical protein
MFASIFSIALWNEGANSSADVRSEWNEQNQMGYAMNVKIMNECHATGHSTGHSTVLSNKRSAEQLLFIAWISITSESPCRPFSSFSDCSAKKESSPCGKFAIYRLELKG